MKECEQDFLRNDSVIKIYQEYGLKTSIHDSYVPLDMLNAYIMISIIKISY